MMSSTIPSLENPAKLSLPPELEHVLLEMFQGYQRVVLKQEFSGGFSGSRVLLVRPIKDAAQPELQEVAKLAPRRLVLKEWQAYQRFIHQRLPGAAQIVGQPVLPEGSHWGGLRYAMMGEGGTFEVESLRTYCQHANLPDLRFVFEEQLFPLLKQIWHVQHMAPEFSLQASYDTVLPVNLLLDAAQSPPPGCTPLLLTPDRLPDSPLQPGDYVRLEGFAVSRVDLSTGLLTLDLPDRSRQAYALRLKAVANIADYLDRDRIDSLGGQVVEVRQERLQREVERAAGQPPMSQFLTLADGACLPNPLPALPALLNRSRDVKVGCIHGDLNMQNILVNPATRTVSLIDFSEARQDHLLHDLFRLETEVIVKYLPSLLAEADLSPQITPALYDRLHQLTFARSMAAPSPDRLPPALEKPLAILRSIRRVARSYLLDPEKWTEYYDGLTLYLLGALKFDNFNDQTKQTALWAAATVRALSQGRPIQPPEETELPTVAAKPGPLKQLGRYQILSPLGQGGMGQVYLARDPDLDREVVIKVISLPLSGGNDEWRRRFKREVQAAARLNHPHIVTVFDVNLDHNPPYVVMERLSGGTLRERLKLQPLSWPEALAWLRPLVEALAAAHRAGIIHRDIKPANIMFAGDNSNSLKLVDFGLARQFESDDSLTQTGHILGTPGYMSPEQVRGEGVNAQTDIFAVGMVLFEAITGRNPLNKGSLVASLAETASPTPVDTTPLLAQTPPPVLGLIERAVAKNCDQRYPTCEALLADWDRCLAQAEAMPGPVVSPAPALAGPASRKAAESPKPLTKANRRWQIGGAIAAVVWVVLALAAGAGWLAWRFIANRPTSSSLVASVISVKPEVEVKRANSRRLEPIAFGMPLYENDVVNTYAGAAAGIACDNGSLFSLPEQSNLAVNCQDTSSKWFVGQLDSSLSQQLVSVSQPTSMTVASLDTRAVRGEQDQSVVLISPRNSYIAQPLPTFEWQPVAGASGYQLSLTLAGGKRWITQTTSTTLTYPADAPALAPGSATIVMLSTVDDKKAVDKSLLRRLDETQGEAVAAAESQIQKLALDEAGRGYLLAQLYRQHELWSPAIAQLEPLVQAQNTPSAQLRQQLGDLYFEVELYDLAEQNYTQALAAAEAAQDGLGQASAQMGLARTAVLFDETAQAGERLTAAETLYRQAGREDLANQAAVERANLPQ